MKQFIISGMLIAGIAAGASATEHRTPITVNHILQDANQKHHDKTDKHKTKHHKTEAKKTSNPVKKDATDKSKKENKKK